MEVLYIEINIKESIFPTYIGYFITFLGKNMIYSNLAVLLAEKKLKVIDLVRITGLSKTTLYKLYNGESIRIDFETLEKICKTLNVDVGDVLQYRPDDIDEG